MKVLRSGRLLPIDDIDEAVLPLVTVVPTRVNFERPEISLQTIQQGISSIVEYEHLPLGKVQTWVRPGRPLFDILFSLSVDESSSNDLWKVIESEPPKADVRYIYYEAPIQLLMVLCTHHTVSTCG